MILQNADFIICCDGALDSFLRNRQKIFGFDKLPDVIVGDMDSLRPTHKKAFAELIVSSDDQETNDMTKAFRYAVDKVGNLASITILGATGKREDHTIGNMSLLMDYATDPAAAGIEIQMISDWSTIFPITDTFEFSCGRGRRISIFTPDNSLKIRSAGLQWKTDDVVFDNWWKATLNRSTEDEVKLEFSHPSKALIVID